MLAQTQNYDYDTINTTEVEPEKLDENQRKLLWWRVGSGFYLIYRITWTLIFSLAVYQDDDLCDDHVLVEFSEVIFCLMIILVPFICLIFVKSIIQKPYKIIKWTRFYYWTIIIATFIDIVLLICSHVFYNEPEALSDSCKIFHLVYEKFILVSSIVLTISAILVLYLWRNTIFGEQENGDSETDSVK